MPSFDPFMPNPNPSGPDELRKRAEYIRQRDDVGDEADAGRLDDAADAWEKALFVAAQRSIDDASTIDALRKRLEAAEKLLDRCMGYLEGDDELRKAVYAALAGEKP
jgi:hypothetical protein